MNLTKHSAIAPGDVRTIKPGETIHLHPSARERSDWDSLVSAFCVAVVRGSSILWVEE